MLLYPNSVGFRVSTKANESSRKQSRLPHLHLGVHVDEQVKCIKVLKEYNARRSIVIK